MGIGSSTDTAEIWDNSESASDNSDNEGCAAEDEVDLHPQLTELESSDSNSCEEPDQPCGDGDDPQQSEQPTTSRAGAVKRPVPADDTEQPSAKKVATVPAEASATQQQQFLARFSEIVDRQTRDNMSFQVGIWWFALNFSTWAVMFDKMKLPACQTKQLGLLLPVQWYLVSEHL